MESGPAEAPLLPALSRTERWGEAESSSGGRLGAFASLALHAAMAALGVGLLTRPPAGLPPAAEQAIEVELIGAESLDSAARREGGAIDIPLPEVPEPAQVEPMADAFVPETPPDLALAAPPEVEVLTAAQFDANAREATAAPPSAPVDLALAPPPEAPVPAIPPTAEPVPEPRPVAAPASSVQPAVPPPPKPMIEARAARPKPAPAQPPEPRRTQPSKPSAPPQSARAAERPALRIAAKPAPSPGRGQGRAGDAAERVESTASLRGGSPVVGSGPGGAAFASFQAQVLAHLARHKRYPEAARLLQAQGRTSVTFSLDASGRVTSVALAGSSGHPILDQETLAMVRRASPFPRIPPEAGRASASFTAPIRYDMRF
ncbi:MAG TPA: TonB family protein [Beijerinckiaceae bacterium]